MTFGVNPGVAITFIGVEMIAFLVYDKRIILLVGKRMQLPSNLKALIYPTLKEMNYHGRLDGITTSIEKLRLTAEGLNNYTNETM